MLSKKLDISVFLISSMKRIFLQDVNILIVNGDNQPVVILKKDQFNDYIKPGETHQDFFNRIRGCWTECLVERINEKNYCRRFVLGRKLTDEFDYVAEVQEEEEEGDEEPMEVDILDDDFGGGYPEDVGPGPRFGSASGSLFGSPVKKQKN